MKVESSKPQENDAHLDICGDLIHCQRLRRSATGRTAAYHVGTRRLDLLLFLAGNGSLPVYFANKIHVL